MSRGHAIDQPNVTVIESEQTVWRSKEDEEGYTDVERVDPAKLASPSAPSAATKSAPTLKDAGGTSRDESLIEGPVTPGLPHDVGVSSPPTPAPAPAPSSPARERSFGPSGDRGGGHQGGWAGPDHGTHAGTV
jgi:hypothetical protein